MQISTKLMRLLRVTVWRSELVDELQSFRQDNVGILPKTLVYIASGWTFWDLFKFNVFLCWQLINQSKARMTPFGIIWYLLKILKIRIENHFLRQKIMKNVAIEYIPKFCKLFAHSDGFSRILFHITLFGVIILLFN